MKDMDIRDKKLMQLFRKTSSSQDKPVGLKVLQQRIGDITYYAMSTFVRLHIWFLSNTEGYTGFFSKNIKELFYELSVTLILSESSS